MGHIELRDLDDDDVDAVFDMMRDPVSVQMAAFTAADPSDRDAFDAWIDRNRNDPDVAMFVITDRGGFAGTIAAFPEGPERHVTYWLPRHAWGRGVATAALRLLVSREAQRPLFARAAAHNVASLAVLRDVGFTEVSRDTAFAAGVGHDVEEVVMALTPEVE